MISKQKYITIKIQRFDPNVDGRKRFQTYRVPGVTEGLQTAMNILEYIYDYMDPTIAFYRSCRGGVCGGCRILINEKPALACMKIIKANATFKPIPNYEIVRDLVVDFKRRIRRSQKLVKSQRKQDISLRQ